MARVSFDPAIWAARQSYSVWTRYDLPAHECRWNMVTEERPLPEHAERTERNLGHVVRAVPRYKDGYFIASCRLSAAIGILDDPTAISSLTGQDRTVTVLDHFYHGTPRNRGWLSFELSYRLGKENKRKKLCALDRIELRRVRQTAVLVTELSDWDLEAVLVDFVPKEPDGNCMLRSVSVRTPSSLPIGNVSLVAVMHPDGDEWRFVRVGRDQVGRSSHGRMGIAGSGRLKANAATDEIELTLTETAPGTFTGTLGLTVGYTDEDVKEALVATREEIADVQGSLGHTANAWQQWHERTPIRVADAQAQDFIDGALTLLKCLEAPESIRLGTVNYSPQSTFVRDNYWIARAFQAAGHLEESAKSCEFFFRTVKEFGLAAAYNAPQPNTPGSGGEERAVELPALVVTMWRDLVAQTGQDPLSEYEFLKRVLAMAMITPDDRQVFNTDEGWIWPMDYPDLALITDNSVLLIDALEYLAQLAAQAGEPEQAGRYADQAKRCRKAIETRHYDARRGYYLTALERDDFPHMSPATTLVSALVNSHFGPPTDDRIYSGLMAAWRLCRRGGILTSTSDSPIVTGFTPGQYLQAIADLNLPFAEHVLAGMWSMCSATGNLWEGYDTYDYTWSGERQRAWDTSVCLLGLLRQVFGICLDPDGITFNPHVLASAGSAAIRDFPVGSDRYDVEAAADRMAVRRNGEVLLEADRPLVLRLRGNRIELLPQFPMLPVTQLTPVMLDVNERTATSGCWPGPIRAVLPVLGVSVISSGGPVAVEGEGWRQKHPASHAGAAVDCAVTDMEYAPIDTLEPGAGFRACGYAFDRDRVPERTVLVEWESVVRGTACDEQGRFSVVLTARQGGNQELSVRTMGAECRKRLRVAWSPTNHWDELIGRSRPTVAIEKTTGGHDAVVALEIMRHKAFRVPIVNRAPEGVNTIRFIPELPQGGLFRGDGYVVQAEQGRCVMVIRKAGHAWRDTLGFLTDLRIGSAPLQPRALNRYFITWELAERLGAPTGSRPKTAVKVEIRSSRIMSFDVQGARRRGKVMRTTLDPSRTSRTAIRGAGDYVTVRVRPGRSLADTVPDAVFGLEYETGANEPAEVELSFTFPVGVVPADMKWGKLWERTLDEAALLHNPDGTLTVRHTLHPGRPAYRNVVEAGFPVRETFPLTRRNVFFEFGRLM